MVSALIDLLYNGILAILVAIWIATVRPARSFHIVALFKRHNLKIALVLWVLFGVFLTSFLVYFPYFTEIHDIDDAVDSATSYLLDGGNPYTDDVVPRFATKYHPDPEFSNGTYNYMPLDLMVYTGAQGVLGFMGAPVWFVSVNLAFSALALFLFRRIVRIRWEAYLPVAGIVMLFYSFDNASFTLLLMVASMYSWRKADERSKAIAIVLMGLGTLTKIYAAIPLLVMILFELQRHLASKDIRRLRNTILAIVGCVVLATVMIAPFGVSSVLDSAVFFHTSEQARVETSAGGTLLSELAMDSGYYGLMSAGIVLAAVIASLRMRSLDDRVLLVMTVFLVVAVKSSLAPLTVMGIFLGSRLRDLVDERSSAREQVTRSAGERSRSESIQQPE